MISSHTLAGAYAPALTPFTSDGKELALDDLRRQLEYIAAAGVDGALLLGTNGEFPWLDQEEKLRLVTTAIESGGNLKFLAGATVPDSPKGTLKLAARLAALESPPAGLLVAPPYYARSAAGKPVPLGELADFFRYLAAEVHPVPVLLYNVPFGKRGQPTAAITAELIRQLADVETVVGVKDSTGSLQNIAAYLEMRPGLQVLVGTDHLIGEGLAAGAAGSITAGGNVFPTAVAAVYQASPGADRTAAQSELSSLRRILELAPGKMIASQKLLLHSLGVVPSQSPVRDPDGELTASERDLVLEELRRVAQSLVINREVRDRVSDTLD
ncbi:MAG: dihydrodipicolinate synthase family protein [Candidatus Neomarinimicrobiota bacterium]